MSEDDWTVSVDVPSSFRLPLDVRTDRPDHADVRDYVKLPHEYG